MRNPEAWLESNVPLVTRIVAAAAYRARLPRQDRDELLSLVWSHLTKDDYRVLRQCCGTPATAAYLRVVIERVLLDMRTAAWGKWRPSAEARRHGEPAVTFERLVVRDGHRPAEAREWLRLTGASLPVELEARLVAKARPRSRRFVALEAAATRPSAIGDPFTQLLQHLDARQGVTLAARLERALTALPPADQVLIRMRHEQGLKVSQIATMLGIDQKKLYRRLDTIHAGLRAVLTGLGVCPSEALDLTRGTVSYVPPVLTRTARAC